MFGKADSNPQNEKTPFKPINPYGVSKLFSYWFTRNYRESYDMFTVAGILYNHESPLLATEFVTRKITHGIAKIKLGLSDYITLGNLDVRRDWGYAPDYVEAMWLMLQQSEPDDYVVASGKSHSLRDFLNIAFNYVGIENWNSYVKISEQFMRPYELNSLVGDITKAKEVLGWIPKVSFEDMVHIMVENDLELLKIKE